MISMGLLHYTTIKHIVDKGYAPDLKSISTLLKNHFSTIQKALYELQNEHDVVLHPEKPDVWIIHPFSTAPTNFLVKTVVVTSQQVIYRLLIMYGRFQKNGMAII